MRNTILLSVAIIFSVLFACSEEKAEIDPDEAKAIPVKEAFRDATRCCHDTNGVWLKAPEAPSGYCQIHEDNLPHYLQCFGTGVIVKKDGKVWEARPPYQPIYY